MRAEFLKYAHRLDFGRREREGITGKTEPTMEFSELETEPLVQIVELAIKGLPPVAAELYPELSTPEIIVPDVFAAALVYFYPDEATRRHLTEDYGGAGFWNNFMWELADLVCSGQKYESTRKKLYATARKSEAVTLSTIAAAISSSIGVVPGVLTPFCAIGLLTLLAAGRDAFCSSFYTKKDNRASKAPVRRAKKVQKS
jgi:hypothetical protein